jgi:hypothetical protein
MNNHPEIPKHCTTTILQTSPLRQFYKDVVLPTWMKPLSKHWLRSAWVAKRPATSLPLGLMLFATDLSGERYAYWDCSALRTSSTQCDACGRWNFPGKYIASSAQIQAPLYTINANLTVALSQLPPLE